MEAIKCIMTRRSVRKYSTKKITDTILRKILEAAMNAPSANNQQAWQFVVVRDRDTLNRITEIHPYAQMLTAAQIAIVICGDPAAEISKNYWVQDCSAATQNALLAAHALGLGAVSLGVHPRLDRVKGVQKLLRLPKGIVPLSIVSIGYPGEKPKPVKRFDRRKIHADAW
jgi:nitroreductase